MEKLDILIAKYIANWDFDKFRDGKVLITFSAIPGAGKTTIAKQLQARYNLARINKDELHDIMVTMSEAHNEELLKAAVQKLTQMLSEKEKVILNDASVDRKYDEVEAWADKTGYKVFLIQIEVPIDVLIHRIKERNKENAADYLKEMDRWVSEHEQFIQNHKCDFIFREGSDLTRLIQSVKEILP